MSGSPPASARQWPNPLPALTARELVDTRIQVLNGNGVQDLARRQRSWLELEGFTVAGIGNHADFAQEHTEIRYRPGSGRVAQILGRLQIRDDGCGIPPDVQKHLFEPFRNRKRQGTGLGLFLSRTFVRRFGGDVRLVESEVGVGSCFEIVFRRVEEGGQ